MTRRKPSARTPKYLWKITYGATPKSRRTTLGFVQANNIIEAHQQAVAAGHIPATAKSSRGEVYDANATVRDGEALWNIEIVWDQEDAPRANPAHVDDDLALIVHHLRAGGRTSGSSHIEIYPASARFSPEGWDRLVLLLIQENEEDDSATVLARVTVDASALAEAVLDTGLSKPSP